LWFLLVTLLFSAAAFAELHGMFGLTFDPGATGRIVSRWVVHLGLPDNSETGHDNYGFLMSKNDFSTANSAFAKLTNVFGRQVTELGYDIRHGSHCGAGAPRFNVTATDGFHFIGGCSNGTKTPSVPGWDRVRFDPSNAAQAFPPVAPGATIKTIFLVSDEGVDVGPEFNGVYVLDNIDFNGFLISEPN
jgi:hypothetical protein